MVINPNLIEQQAIKQTYSFWLHLSSANIQGVPTSFGHEVRYLY